MLGTLEWVVGVELCRAHVSGCFDKPSNQGHTCSVVCSSSTPGAGGSDVGWASSSLEVPLSKIGRWTFFDRDFLSLGCSGSVRRLASARLDGNAGMSSV